MKNLAERPKVIMIPNNHAYIHELTKALKEKNVSVTLLPSFHYSTLSNIIKILRLRKKGYDIIHIQWTYIFPFTFLMKFFVKLFRKLNFKIVWTIHDFHEESLKSRYSSKERLVWLYDNSDYRFIHYKSNIASFEKIIEKKVNNTEVIYHPVFSSYKNTISAEKSRELLSLQKKDKVLLLFGKIRKYKGFELFIKAFESLDKEYKGLIVGQSSHPDLVKVLKEKEKILPNIKIFDKYISDDDLQIYFNAADVVILPYLSITTSGVALLAYHFRKPVITTNIGGMPETVFDGETGLLIDPNDIEGLIIAIKKIFKMDYKKMGDKAFEMKKIKFNWDNLAEKTKNVYEKVIKNDCKKK